MGLIAKDLFGEIWVNFQLLQNPISEHTALSMVVYLKFLGQLNFIEVQTQVLTQNSQVEVAERPSSCERREIDRLEFSRTLSRTAVMFSVDLAFRRRIGLFIKSVDEFGHQTSNSRFGRTVVARNKEIKIT